MIGDFFMGVGIVGGTSFSCGVLMAYVQLRRGEPAYPSTLVDGSLLIGGIVGCLLAGWVLP